jgi:hypothetical protein
MPADCVKIAPSFQGQVAGADVGYQFVFAVAGLLERPEQSPAGLAEGFGFD